MHISKSPSGNPQAWAGCTSPAFVSSVKSRLVAEAAAGSSNTVSFVRINRPDLRAASLDRAHRLRLELPSGRGSFGYYVFFAQTDGGSIYGKREITIGDQDAFAYHHLLIADPQPSGTGWRRAVWRWKRRATERWRRTPTSGPPPPRTRRRRRSATGRCRGRAPRAQRRRSAPSGSRPP
jgi:hypothetical protein